MPSLSAFWHSYFADSELRRSTCLTSRNRRIAEAENAQIMGNSLISGLEAFAEQFRAQTESAGLPVSEHAIHFCLALGLQAAPAWSNAGRAEAWSSIASPPPSTGRQIMILNGCAA